MYHISVIPERDAAASQSKHPYIRRGDAGTVAAVSCAKLLCVVMMLRNKHKRHNLKPDMQHLEI